MKWWAFVAYNTETLYGFGSEDEAQQYVGVLNLGREINCYQYANVEPEMVERLERGNQGFDIAQELAA